MSVLRETSSKHGIDAIALLYHEEVLEIIAKARNQGTNIPYYLRGHVKSLQLYLKNLQEKGLFSIDSSFDYSSIDGSNFRNF